MRRFRVFSQLRSAPWRLLTPGLLLVLSVVAACSSRESALDPFLPLGDRLAYQSPPAGITAGAPFGFVVRIVDTEGNTVQRTGVDIALTLDSTDPRDTLLGPTVSQTILGQAVFSGLVLKRAAPSFRILASARGLTGVVSPPFGVTVGPPARLAFTVQPSVVMAGEKMVPAPQVVVQDAVGNAIPNDTGLVVLQVLTGPGTTPRNNAVNAVAGTARFDSLRISVTAPSITLTAVGPTSRNLAPAVSNVFSVTPGAPFRLLFTTSPSTTPVNSAINPPVQVTVIDSMNNVASSFAQPVSLQFDVNPTGATFGGTTTVNAAGGVATFSGISINLVSAGYRLRAVSATVPDTARSAFFQIVP